MLQHNIWQRSWITYTKQIVLGLLVTGMTAFGAVAQGSEDNVKLPAEVQEMAEESWKKVYHAEDLGNNGVADFAVLSPGEQYYSMNATFLYKDEGGNWHKDAAPRQGPFETKPGFHRGVYLEDVDNDGYKDFIVPPYYNPDKERREGIIYFREDNYINKVLYIGKEEINKSYSNIESTLKATSETLLH